MIVGQRHCNGHLATQHMHMDHSLTLAAIRHPPLQALQSVLLVAFLSQLTRQSGWSFATLASPTHLAETRPPQLGKWVRFAAGKSQSGATATTTLGRDYPMTPVYRQIRTGGEAHMVRFRVYVQDGPRVRIPNNTERVRRLPKWPFSFFPSVFSADAGPSAGTSIEAAVSRIACSVCSG